MNSFVLDWSARLKQSGLHLIWAVLEDLPLPPHNISYREFIQQQVAALTFVSPTSTLDYVSTRLDLTKPALGTAFRYHERLRRRSMIDSLVAQAYGLNYRDLSWILRDCDQPLHYSAKDHGALQRDSKGFWRVDKEKDPELRHTVLSLIAFHDLLAKVAECGGNCDKGIEAFLVQNNGEGWMIPETLRLADYGLGHDDRAKQHQPVASRLGPRFYDWQLAQSAEESWKECHLHARNLLGEEGYKRLLEDIRTGEKGEPPAQSNSNTIVKESGSKYQGNLFD
jgi:hypothetical protein